MSLAKLLNQTISIKNGTGAFDVHGKPTLATSTTAPARFERTYKTIVTENQDKEPIHGVIFVEPSVSVSIGAEVTYDSTKFRVMQIDDVIARGPGVHHKELLVQLWSYAA